MDFSAPHFENRLCLWVPALALISLGVLIAFASAARKRQLAVFVDDSAVDRLLQTYSPIRRGIKTALILLSVAFLGVALARPQWGQRSDTTAVSGEDTIFVLDTSKSMLAADVRPNRPRGHAGQVRPP